MQYITTCMVVTLKKNFNMDLQNKLINLHRSIYQRTDIESIIKDITELGAQVSTLSTTPERLFHMSSGLQVRWYKNGTCLIYKENTGMIYGVGLSSIDKVYVWYWNTEVGNELGGIGNTKFIPVAINSKYLSMMKMASELLSDEDLSDDSILSVAKKYTELPCTISGLLMSKVILPTEKGYRVNPKYLFERKIDSFTKYVTVDGLHSITDRNSIVLEDIKYEKEDVILFTKIGNKNIKVVVENGFKSMPTPLVVKETIEKFYNLK